MNKTVLTFFWQHIKPYKWLYFIMLCAPIVGSFHILAYNYAVKLLVDTLSTEGCLILSHLYFPCILFIGAEISNILAWRISNIAEWKGEPYVRKSIVLKSYDYVQHHAYLFFQENFTGSLTSKIKGLWDGYDKFWAEMHHGLFQNVLKSLVSLGALFFVNIPLGFFVLIWAIIYVPVTYKLTLKLNELSREESESSHSIMGQISDNITNIMSLFSFSSRKRELNLLEKNFTRDFIPKQVRTYKYDFKVQLVLDFLYFTLLATLLVMMIYLRLNDKVSIGDFAFVFSTVSVATFELWGATTALRDFSRTMGQVSSTLSILHLPQENKDIRNAKPLVVREPTINFENVTFGYTPETPVLKNITLSLKAGQKVGLVGHSGAGKSSLVNLLLRYFSPDKGQILISQQDIGESTQDSVRDHIAVIPQDILLFHRTLLENIRYGNPKATNEDVIRASKKAHIHEFIMSLPEQYETYVGERGIKLSGGQRQRIAIARAILKDAPILVLDEATSSLDSHTEKQIQESLSFLIQNKKKTVIAIAHRLSTLKHMDKIIVLDKGEVVEEGTHETLIQNPKSLYTKLWKLQEIT